MDPDRKDADDADDAGSAQDSKAAAGNDAGPQSGPVAETPMTEDELWRPIRKRKVFRRISAPRPDGESSDG